MTGFVSPRLPAGMAKEEHDLVSHYFPIRPFTSEKALCGYVFQAFPAPADMGAQSRCPVCIGFLVYYGHAAVDVTMLGFALADRLEIAEAADANSAKHLLWGRAYHEAAKALRQLTASDPEPSV